MTAGGSGRRSPTIVTAAVVERDGRLLLTRRIEGTHLAGHWEFPGGKCEPAESPEDCLARELKEELGVGARIGRELYRTLYAYGGRTLDLRFFECEIDGEPIALLGQEIRWAGRHELRGLRFPPADAELVEMLGRPPHADHP